MDKPFSRTSNAQSATSRLQTKTNTKTKKQHRRRGFWFYCRWFLLICFILGLIAAGIIIAKVYPLLQNLPSPDELVNGNERFNVATQIYDRNGVKLYDLYDDERRVPIKIADLPPYVAQASIAIEDKKFYSHHGFDPISIIRAFIVNKVRGEYAQGGSTITQQLIKKAFLSGEKSYDRKIKEIALAIITETRYSKDQILEMYLNYISYGGTAVGIGSAAETYFGKSATELTLAEASLLAGLPQAPSRYSPFQSDSSAAKNRQKEVLKNMVEMGYITQAQADEAAAEELIYTTKRTSIQAPHFVFYVKDLLIEQFGEEKVMRGGLRVTTTLDLTTQETAEATLAAELATLEKLDVGNGAAMITKPNTGEILAMVGSKDYYDIEHDGQFNVTTALRQPGSSIKPLVYATAFEQKALNPSSVLLDVPTCFQNIGQPNYCPKNYSGGFNGPTTVRQALGSSLNIPAVKALRIIGLESFIYQAQKMGITTWEDAKNYGWSLSLGGGEVKMTDMATAFGSLANMGVKMPQLAILKVEDYQGKVLYQADLQERKKILADMQANPEISYEDLSDGNTIERVLNNAPAYLITDIMRDDRARWLGFGSRSQLVIKDKDVAVKTGTTNDVRDNWTVGFTPEILTIVWVGNTDSSVMNNRLVSGVTGAAPIWHDIMTWLLRDDTYSDDWPAVEDMEDIKEANVCWTGMPRRDKDFARDEEGNVIGDNCGEEKKDKYWVDSAPTRSGVRREAAYYCSNTGLPPTGKEDEDCGEMQAGEFLIAQDPFNNYYCIDCPRPVNEQGKTVRDPDYYIGEEIAPAQYGDEAFTPTE
ncbi:PBP1A family penicillin-binding protein [bacterium]|nr:PBP1A family penicillin-binding protein [bacterium]